MSRLLRTQTRRALLAAAALFVLLGAGARPGSTQPADAQGPIGNLLQPFSLLVGLTPNNQLVLFSNLFPGNALFTANITGLASQGETIVGIDMRPANGQLYAVSSANRLYTVNPYTGFATPAGQTPFAVPLDGTEFGVDVNPVPDRVRVVSNARQNLRLNPDTGAVVDGDAAMPGIQPDGRLTYDAMDTNANATPRIVAAAYTNNVAGATTTTNYAIDAGLGILVTQGSLNGTPVGPNTGRLFTVGRLEAGAFDTAGFDIAPNGRAYAALTPPGAGSSSLYAIELMSGKATPLGTIGGGQPIRGLAVIR